MDRRESWGVEGPAEAGLTKVVVEVAPPTRGWRGLEGMTEAARRGARAVRAEGADVRFLRAVYLAEDDTCLFVFEASDPAAVYEAGRRGRLTFAPVAGTPPAGLSGSGRQEATLTEGMGRSS